MGDDYFDDMLEEYIDSLYDPDFDFSLTEKERVEERSDRELVQQLKDSYLQSQEFIGVPEKIGADLLEQKYQKTIFYIKAVGVTYGDRQNVIRKLNKGDKLFLRPEPTNPYDKNAILILTEDEKEVGYISNEYNSNWLKNINLGCKYHLTVDSITGQGVYNKLGLNIKVVCLKPNQYEYKNTESYVNKNDNLIKEKNFKNDYQFSTNEEKETPFWLKVFWWILGLQILGCLIYLFD